MTPALSVADTSFPEGTSWFSVKFVQVPVSLFEPADDDVTVSYATSNGTATAGSDYGAVSGEVTIPEGSTGATVSIRVAMDRSREANETFNLTLSNPVDASVADGSAVITIQNDD